MLFRLTYSRRASEISAWTFNRQRVSKNAEIIINSVKGSGSFELMIQSSSQNKVLSMSDVFICNRTVPAFEFISINQVDLQNLPQSFPINPNMKGGIYCFTVYNCVNTFSISKITFSFLNTWGRLPFDKYPLIYICFIESGFYLVLFILVLLNSFKHRELQVLLHYLIVATVLITLVSTLTSAILYLYTNDKSGIKIDQNAIFVSASVLLCLRNYCLLLLSLFLVSGISIVYDVLDRCKVAQIIAISTVFTIVEFVLDSSVSDDFSLGLYAVVFIAFIACYILFAILLSNLSSHSLNTLDAHIAMIYAANIDPETTPSFRKKKLLLTCRRCSFAILLLFIFSTIFYRVGMLYYFIAYLIIAISMGILLSIICWTCRLRQNMAATYCDDEDAYLAFDGQNEAENPTPVSNMRQFQYQTDPSQNFTQPQDQGEIPISPYALPSASAAPVQGDQPSQTPVEAADSSATPNRRDSARLRGILTSPYDKANYGENEDLSLSSFTSDEEGRGIGKGEKNDHNENDNNDGENGENNGSAQNPYIQTLASIANPFLQSHEGANNGEIGGANVNASAGEGENENENGEERPRSGLVAWEYGMKLPPMPQEDFNQNQVHPAD